MNKRLIVCCDGTWQKTDSLYPTNVAKLIQAIPVSSENLVFYGEGVGTGDLADRILGGALGWGLDKNIQDAYRFLSSNYAAGDQIYLFGFSRGAYTVRSLVGMIRAVGMLPRSGIRQIPKAYKAYQDAKGKFSDLLDRDRHATSIDENRKEFDFTKMEAAANTTNQVKQIWFPGGHGCIGGGTKANSPLSNAALLWMMEEVEALQLGLSFDRSKIEDGVQTGSTIFFSNDLTFPFTPHDRIIPTTDDLHPSVHQRWQACSWYRPKPLNAEPFKSQLGNSPDPVPTGILAVGQQSQFVVMAQNPENRTSVLIEKGGNYTISASPLQVWQDAQISCTAAGWKIVKSDDDNNWSIQSMETQNIPTALGKFYQLSKTLSRASEAEWMELVVEIEDEKHQIGLDLSVNFIAATSGELIAYANDAPGFYQNNQGWIFANITRIS